MDWLTVLMITFSATAANHLGLVAAVEEVIKHRLPVVNCPKCLAFWSVLMYGCYGIATHDTATTAALAVAFLAAWAAVWLDLAMGLVDKIYLMLYEQIYSTTDIADTDALGADDTVPGLRRHADSDTDTGAEKETE